MSLVKGFTDIIAPQNLATNGSFRINQRGLFTSLTPVVANDYVCDGWYVTSNTNVDYVEATSSTSGNLRFKGHGKKGQQVYLRHRAGQDIIPAIYATAGFSQKDITVTVLAKLVAGSVPVKISVLPPSIVGYSTVYESQNTLKGTEAKQITAIRKSPVGATTASNPGALIAVLLADGEFDFAFSDYCVYSGAFVNPPISLIPLADDLLRCKRYYQSGTVPGYSEMYVVRDTSTAQSIMRFQHFEVQMAGTPTVAVNPDLTNIQLHNLAPTSDAPISDPATNWVGSAYNVTPQFCNLILTRNTRLLSITPAVLVQGNLNWTATV